MELTKSGLFRKCSSLEFNVVVDWTFNKNKQQKVPFGRNSLKAKLPWYFKIAF